MIENNNITNVVRKLDKTTLKLYSTSRIRTRSTPLTLTSLGLLSFQTASDADGFRKDQQQED